MEVLRTGVRLPPPPPIKKSGLILVHFSLSVLWITYSWYNHVNHWAKWKKEQHSFKGQLPLNDCMHLQDDYACQLVYPPYFAIFATEPNFFCFSKTEFARKVVTYKKFSLIISFIIKDNYLILNTLLSIQIPLDKY